MAFALSSQPLQILTCFAKPHQFKLQEFCPPLLKTNQRFIKFKSFSKTRGFTQKGSFRNSYFCLEAPKGLFSSSVCSSDDEILEKSEALLKTRGFTQKGSFRNSSFHFEAPKGLFSSSVCGSDDEILEKSEALLGIEEVKPVKFLLWVVFWASVSVGIFAFSKDANAAVDSIKASGFGVKVANSLRGLGWSDEGVVLALATLPVIELRGAIPVGYWLQLDPVMLTVLAVLGNMVPVPFIILYLKKFANFMAGKNQSASRFLEMIFEKAREKAGPVEEFQWLGLMLFVAVPFPGTGAWTGAIVASILDMPFWPAVSANFFGVVLAGLLVNLLVNLGLKYAIVAGIILFIISTFMWSILRSLKRSLSSAS